MMNIDQTKLDTLIERAVADLAAGYGGVMISLGDRLGLYRAMADAGPLTADATINIDGSAYKATVETKVDGITTTVDGAYSGKQLDLSSTLAPLARVGELFDLKGISTDTFKVNAKVAPSTANDFEIKQFQANVGNNQLTAQGRIAMAGESNISLTLASPNPIGL